MKRRATYSDLASLPDDVIGELVDGELIVSPRPRPRHSNAATGVVGDLRHPFQSGRGGPGGWWILLEPELHLVDDVLVPDVAGWRREHLPEISDEVGITVTPDWVCEILSPSTARTDLMVKLPIYAKRGVQTAWIVDPANRTLQVYRLEHGAWVVAQSFAGDARVRAQPFEAIELELAAWWSSPG